MGVLCTFGGTLVVIDAHPFCAVKDSESMMSREQGHPCELASLFR
jgi:hypothetical protein